MDGYQMVENEIRVTSQGLIHNYVNYAGSLLQEKQMPEIVLQAMGQAINKAVIVAEIIKKRIPQLHQDTAISSVSITNTFESTEKGFRTVEKRRHVPVISITLSTNELNKDSPGYQPPSNEERIQPVYNYEPHQQAPSNAEQTKRRYRRQPQPRRQVVGVHNNNNRDTYERERGRGRGRGRGWNNGGYYNYEDYGEYSNRGRGFQGTQGSRGDHGGLGYHGDEHFNIFPGDVYGGDRGRYRGRGRGRGAGYGGRGYIRGGGRVVNQAYFNILPVDDGYGGDRGRGRSRGRGRGAVYGGRGRGYIRGGGRMVNRARGGGV